MASKLLGIIQFLLFKPQQALWLVFLLPFSTFPRNVFRPFVLHKSHDEIGRLNGWRLHRDGLHLNNSGGKFLADLVQAFTKVERGDTYGESARTHLSGIGRLDIVLASTL